MKNYVLLLALAGAVIACGGGEKKEEKPAASETESSTAKDLSSNPDYTKGLELIGKSDCLTCHKVKEKLIGPAYQDVADKYENNEENLSMLAGKIIKGGKGVWGEIPMTPHPQITEADAQQMIKYIFLLKK